MRKSPASSWIFVAVLAVTAPSCAIKIVKVDQQTVMEDEAAGEWPEFEKQIIQKSQSSTPTPFPTVAASARKQRLFNVLNGELAAPGEREREGKGGGEGEDGRAGDAQAAKAAQTKPRAQARGKAGSR